MDRMALCVFMPTAPHFACGFCSEAFLLRASLFVFRVRVFRCLRAVHSVRALSPFPVGRHSALRSRQDLWAAPKANSASESCWQWASIANYGGLWLSCWREAHCKDHLCVCMFALGLVCSNHSAPHSAMMLPRPKRDAASTDAAGRASSPNEVIMAPVMNACYDSATGSRPVPLCAGAIASPNSASHFTSRCIVRICK